MTEEYLRYTLGVARGCLGLPEETYVFADYLADHLVHARNPFWAAVSITMAYQDIYERRHVDPVSEGPLPFDILRHRAGILKNAKFVLQVIDADAGAEYSKRLHDYCEEMLGWRVPRRLPTAQCQNEEFYQELFDDNIKVAVEWWAGAIQMAHQFTAEEITAFRGTLALKIATHLQMGRDLELVTNEHIDPVLREAFDATGLSADVAHRAFPAERWMFIDDHGVQVVDINGTQLWQKTLANKAEQTA